MAYIRWKLTIRFNEKFLLNNKCKLYFFLKTVLCFYQLNHLTILNGVKDDTFIGTERKICQSLPVKDFPLFESFKALIDNFENLELPAVS